MRLTICGNTAEITSKALQVLWACPEPPARLGTALPVFSSSSERNQSMSATPYLLRWHRPRTGLAACMSQAHSMGLVGWTWWMEGGTQWVFKMATFRAAHRQGIVCACVCLSHTVALADTASLSRHHLLLLDLLPPSADVGCCAAQPKYLFPRISVCRMMICCCC